jgi:lysophospholipase L1-like esterase
MTRHLPVRRVVCVALALVIALAATLSTSAAPVYPNSMASLGDSITRAFNTSWFPFIDAPANSWSTGTSATVNSLYLRIRALNPNINGKNYNYAVSGAKMVDLAGQVAKVPTNIEYVTILMGANDVCTSSEGSMTAVATFRSQFQSALTSLTARAPNARIFVVSIPDIYRLWDLFKNNSSARSRWATYRICQSMLANPTSTAQADVDRRARVRQRNIDFNTQLAEVCALYPKCRFDGNVAFYTAFVASDVSSRDYFHPSLAGQAKLALVAWGAEDFAPR